VEILVANLVAKMFLDTSVTNSKRLTDLMIERFRAPDGKRVVLWDLAEAGLGVRVGAKRRTFVLKLRHGERQEMLVLGQFPSMNIADARGSARKLKALSMRGVDPADSLRSPRGEAGFSGRSTVGELVEAYIELHAKPNQRSWKDTAGRLKNHLVSRLGTKPISAVTRPDIVRMLDSLRRNGMAQGSNRTLAHTRRFMTWCVERGVIEHSPAAGIRPPAKERPRDRVLSEVEIANVWRACLTMRFPIGPAVQILLLTGQRREEVSCMRWDEVDRSNGIWTIPGERNKSGRPHLVPLSSSALAILDRLPASDQFIFWGRTPARAINGWSVAKRRIDELCGVEDWRIHDLRRTAATGMARLGFDPHIVERVLNHATSTAGPLARVYQRHAYEDEKRQALEAWAVEVEHISQQASHSDRSEVSQADPVRL